MADLTLTSPYGAVLEAQREDLVAALTPHVTPAVIESAHRRSARLSVRLDGSPLDDATADAVDRGEVPVRPVATAGYAGGASWASALKLEGMPTQDIAAVEYAGVRAAQAGEPGLAAGFLDAPVDTLVALQRRVVAGLLSDDRLGTLRRTRRAVNDGAQGRVIFHAPEPPRLAALMEGLDAWVRASAGRCTPLEIAGVVHLRMLHWQPFEAGNGRVGRAVARVALRATGGDPWGLAVPEEVYADDPLPYVAEVAASIHRRTDVRPWIERTAEATVGSLEELARGLGALPDNVLVRGVHECQQLPPGAQITVTEYAAAAGVDRPSALTQLNRLCWTGLLRRDLGTHGLRYLRRRGPGVQ